MEMRKPTWPGPIVRCPQCGCVIEDRIDQHIGVCSDLRCRGPYLAQKSKEREEARRAADKALIQNTTENLRQELAPELYSIVQETCSSGRVSKVPSCDDSMTELPAERVQKFSEHLKKSLQKAAVIITEPRSIQSVLTEYAHRELENEPKPILPVVNGCTTCRGYCCRNGTDTAFLSAEQIAWQLLSDPTLTIESVEKWYIMQLPKLTIEDSCVYHTDQGCSLHRKQRASICNDFHCWELQDVLAKHQEGDEVAWTSIASSSQRAGLRVGITIPGRDRVEIELSGLKVETKQE